MWAFDHIDVTKNNGGTYTVVGGEANRDKNIYVVGDKGKRTGEVVGEMLTEYSFHREDGSAVVGTRIDVNDKSGQEFIDKDIAGGNPGKTDYMLNATKGKKFDFKRQGARETKTLMIYAICIEVCRLMVKSLQQEILGIMLQVSSLGEKD